MNECPVKALFLVGVFITSGFSVFDLSEDSRSFWCSLSRLLIKLTPSCLPLASVTFRLVNLLLASCV